MAFGVVVAGTGALSGMGGQKRYRVNRFRRDLLFRGFGNRTNVESTADIYGPRMSARLRTERILSTKLFIAFRFFPPLSILYNRRDCGAF